MKKWKSLLNLVTSLKETEENLAYSAPDNDEEFDSTDFADEVIENTEYDEEFDEDTEEVFDSPMVESDVETVEVAIDDFAIRHLVEWYFIFIYAAIILDDDCGYLDESVSGSRGCT
mgnify:CR=1 FL=1